LSAPSENRLIAFEAAFAALAVASAYILAVVPNVECFTLIIFLAGVFLGPVRGARVGATAALIYGVANPYGFPGLPMLAALVVSRALIGALGGAMASIVMHGSRVLWLAAAAVIATLVFQALTNLVVGLTMGQLRATFVLALPFALTNLVSNLVVFVLAGGGALRVAPHIPVDGLMPRERS
jgi:hypothetical protein